MTKLEEVEKKIAELGTELKILKDERDKLISESTIVCPRCKKRHRISSVEYIRTHWYESPHGCTGGDIWHEGEGQWVCLHCKAVNRLIEHWEPKSKYFIEHKRRFKSIKDIFEKC